MSGFLNNKKKKFICLLIVCAGIYLALIGFGAYLLLGLYTAVLLLLACDIYAYEKNRKNARELNATGTIRNVDYLIIGDMCSIKDIVPSGATYFAICCPGRSMFASYEIMRHTFSIAKEEGYVVIACRRDRIDSREITVFDMPYLNQLSIKRMNLAKLKKKEKLVLFLKPVQTIKLLLSCFHGQYRYEKNPFVLPEIDEFCKIRNLKLDLVIID